MKFGIERIDEFRWRIPRAGGMKTEAIVYGNEELIRLASEDGSLLQLSNVACLPGIVGPALAMPDIHYGYGFPIGGVAAFDARDGVISPGGVGYDINCGVRLVASPLHRSEIKGHERALIEGLFSSIPAGVGSERRDLTFSLSEEKKILEGGASRVIRQGYGKIEDLESIESFGTLPGAVADYVSETALERGKNQCGTLGSGNHFVEVGYVSKIFDEEKANLMGLFEDQVTVIIHSGSRGIGHQVCEDYLRVAQKVSQKAGIDLPDSHLAALPLRSEEAGRYFGAMNAVSNFAFANRQFLTHFVRETFTKFFGPKVSDKMNVIYDVCHNIAKKETHRVDGKKRKLLVHRKGATRAFPPGHPGLPERFQYIGQPVLVPGDMGRCSYALTGALAAAEQTFCSVCHGAGRRLSRKQAKKVLKGRVFDKELEERGIFVRAASRGTLVEEMSEAYKDISEVVDVIVGAGLCVKVVKLNPIGVVKG